MIELVLALQLLGGPGATPPSHLVPPLSLGGEARLAQVRPELAGVPPELAPPAPGRRPVRVTTVLGASAGVAIADLASMVPIALGLILCLDEVVSWGQSNECRRGTPFLVGGLVSFVFLPIHARRGGAAGGGAVARPGGRGGAGEGSGGGAEVVRRRRAFPEGERNGGGGGGGPRLRPRVRRRPVRGAVAASPKAGLSSSLQ